MAHSCLLKRQSCLLAWVMTTETVHKGTEWTDIDPALKHRQDAAFASEVTGGLWGSEDNSISGESLNHWKYIVWASCL